MHMTMSRRDTISLFNFLFWLRVFAVFHFFVLAFSLSESAPMRDMEGNTVHGSDVMHGTSDGMELATRAN